MAAPEEGLKPKRVKRRSSINGTRSVLGVQGKDAKFEYRIVNDIGDRINKFTENGWEVVTDSDVSIGERKINNPTAKGSVVSASVGQGTTGMLMRIPKEFYEEDQAEKAKQIDKTEHSIKQRSQEEGFYGKLSIDIKRP